VSGDAGSEGRQGAAGWETVVGLEVHVQLRTATKMFCGCPADVGAPPNTNVCPVCLGLPGALPVPNQQAVRLALRAALALRCSVPGSSRFDRKNYFYPDLPKGYQITQYHRPLAVDGGLPVPVEGGEREVRVRRLHLEEDAGKSLHDRFRGSTAVDLNRAGVPLVEIVTEPDLRSPGEARAFLTRLKQILEHYAAVSDCNMEEGSLRVDANLSVRPAGSTVPGTKVEVKNLNSFRNIEKALGHERDRQVAELERGGEVAQETRAYDAAAGITREMRGKEEAFDYRYFPEPDLPPLELGEDQVEAVRSELPELPRVLERRLRATYGLSDYDAARMAAYPARAAYFEAAAEGRGEGFAKQVANFITGPVAEELNRRRPGVREPDLLAPGDLARVAELRLDGTLSSSTADRALERLLEADGAPDPEEVVREHGLVQVRDTERLAEWVEGAVAAHPEEARRYARGEEKLLGFFMGAVMREAGGKADPEKARQLLRDRLDAVEAREGGGGAA
jgi:aspartyl-tRNA(Asn)/glutamyl-tRNA(Gln) amidotransferase subunit B